PPHLFTPPSPPSTSTLSLHDALPIYDTLILALARGRGYQWPDCYGYSHPLATASCPVGQSPPDYSSERSTLVPTGAAFIDSSGRSEEHTSELQSRSDLVCRLLLEKKK